LRDSVSNRTLSSREKAVISANCCAGGVRDQELVKQAWTTKKVSGGSACRVEPTVFERQNGTVPPGHILVAATVREKGTREMLGRLIRGAPITISATASIRQSASLHVVDPSR
jgi:hypothetical protein